MMRVEATIKEVHTSDHGGVWTYAVDDCLLCGERHPETDLVFERATDETFDLLPDPGWGPFCRGCLVWLTNNLTGSK